FPPRRSSDLPRVLAELAVAERLGGQLTEKDVAIDPLVGAELVVAERREGRRPIRGERQAALATGGRQLRPTRIVGVVPDPRREQWIEGERGVEERVDSVAEGRHGRGV